MQALVVRTANETAEYDLARAARAGVFLSQITIGVARCGRGELLSANHLIRGWASRSSASLLASFIVPANGSASDSLDPNRRFELAYPALAAEISAALDLPLLDCARSLLTVAERELSGRVPSLSPAAIGAVRGTVDRAQAVDQEIG